MPYFIPAECDLQQRPVSEQVVYEVIRDTFNDKWIVFHSFDFITRDGSSRRVGEIDFLLYHPVFGLLVLEVKGGVIKHIDGQWYQDGHPISNPVKQALKNRFAVMQLFEKNNNNQPVPLRFAHAVCFPSLHAHDVWTPALDGIVVTRDDFDDLPSVCRRILEETQYPEGMTGTVTRAEVLSTLTPCFEYGVALGERIPFEQRLFTALTRQQLKLLDAFAAFRRLVIRGCAGSGKTVMAVKRARQLGLAGKRVLLLCFNQLLAENLQAELRGVSNVTASAFYEFCIDVMPFNREQIDRRRSDPLLYTELLPKYFPMFLERTHLQYDAVIVDEGQDFSAQMWGLVQQLLAPDGFFYVFYDEDQSIFQTVPTPPDFGYPPVQLTINCRNTQNIFAEVQKHADFHCSCMDSAPIGAPVESHWGECLRHLGEILEQLLGQDHLEPQDIVILGAHSLPHTELAEQSQFGDYTVVERRGNPEKKEISYFTFMKFKGCEAKVAILFGVDEKDKRWSNRHNLYTAKSRAIHKLFILNK